MELNTIQQKGKWSEISDTLNENFAKVNAETQRIELASRKNKGYFANASELTTKVPTALIGDIAYVGAKYPYDIYRWVNNAWTDSGEKGGEGGILVQTEGDNDYAVMSQKAVSERFKVLNKGLETQEETSKVLQESIKTLDKEAVDKLYVSEWKSVPSGDYITGLNIKMGDAFSYKFDAEGEIGRVTLFPNGDNSTAHRIKDSATSEFLPNVWYDAIAIEDISRLGLYIYNTSMYRLTLKLKSTLGKVVSWIGDKGNISEDKLADNSVSDAKLKSELSSKINKSFDFVSTKLSDEEITDNDVFNSFFKEIYVLNINDYSRVQIVRGKYYSNTSKYRNLIRLWRTDNTSVMLYINEKDTLEELVQNEQRILDTAVVNWGSIATGTELYINLNDLTFKKDVGNIQNAPTIAALVNYHGSKTVKSSSEEINLTSNTNNVKLINGNKAVLTKDAVLLLDKFIHSTEIHAPSKINIIEPIEKKGRFERRLPMIYQFGEESVVVNKSINPTYELKDYSNSTVSEEPDGIKTIFSLPYACSEKKDVSVYLNGARLMLGVEYDVIPSNGILVFNEAPPKGSRVVVDFTVEVESFIVNYSFNNLKLIDNKFKGIDDTLEFNDATFYSYERGWISTYYPTTDEKPNAISVNIEPSPTEEGKNVLHFHAEDIGAQNKVRAQIQIGNTNGKEIENIVDVFFPESTKLMLNAGGEWDSLPSGGSNDTINWFTLQEWWVYGTTSSGGIGQRFRMSLNLIKTQEWDGECYFSLTAEEIDDNGNGQEFSFLYRIDGRTDKKFPIPFGEWFTLTTYIKGGVNNGEFVLSAINSRGEKIEIFNEHIQTLPSYALIPNEANVSYAGYNGVENPMKIYFSKDIMDYMISQGRSIDVYFKNWYYKNTGVIEK